MDEQTPDNKDFIADEYVEVYYAYQFTDIDILIDALRQNGILCEKRGLAPAQFPFTVGKHSQTRISVRRDQVDEAVEIIRQALADGAITDEGAFMFEP